MANVSQNRDEIAKWLRLHLTGQVGPRTFGKLLEYFGGIDAALGASAGQLTHIDGISHKKANQIAADRDAVDVDAELAFADKLGVEIICIESGCYPPLLKKTYDPPYVLYIKGEIIRADSLAIAVVGSRGCSHYGLEQSSRLSYLMAAAGFTVVSGMARGIDTAGHRGALAGGGRTIAVLGCGLANVYPSENAELSKLIAQNGAVISELPLTTAPSGTNFPARNRIIAGMALGTMVVEAGNRSGAQITARFAMENNREVMAVPGRVDAPGSKGPHRLIKDGAKLVEGIEDIIEALGHLGDTLKEHTAETSDQAQKTAEPTLFSTDDLNLAEPELLVIDMLDTEPYHIDRIIAETKLPPGKVNAAVTSLQLKGLIKQLPGSYYQRRWKSNKVTK